MRDFSSMIIGFHEVDSLMEDPATGETYLPQFMSMDAYQAIIDESGMGCDQGSGARGDRGGNP